MSGRPGFADSIKNSIDREMNRRVSKAWKAGKEYAEKEVAEQIKALEMVVAEQAIKIETYQEILERSKKVLKKNLLEQASRIL